MTYRFIFEVKVRKGMEEAFVRNWREGSTQIQQMPGARGTRLHQKRGELGTYVAIAEWESKELRLAAIAELGKEKNWKCNSDFGEVTTLAELDEIDSVIPWP